MPPLSSVMTAAWALARRGAAKFGGSVRSYLADALRQAWPEIRRLYRESYLPVTERTVPQPIFRWADEHDVYLVSHLADAFETYCRKSAEAFDARFDEHVLQIACLCFSVKRHRLRRLHHSFRKGRREQSS